MKKENKNIKNILHDWYWFFALCLITLIIIPILFYMSMDEAKHQDCIAKAYCNELGLDFQKFENGKVVICNRTIMENMTTMAFRFDVENKTILESRYQEKCPKK